MMEIIAYQMEYNGLTIETSDIMCVPFAQKYFDEYMRIYNECFYEMRKSLETEPYNFLSDYDQIREKCNDIYLLLNNGEIVGSIACYGNEIDDLVVNKKYQDRGYGKQLLLWGMSKIREKNNNPITLHVAKWNNTALLLYEKVGFEISRIEKIR